MFDYQLEHICSYRATLRMPPETIGPVPEGIRSNAYVTGGEVYGPKIHGRILGVGGDWLLIRRDGVGVVDVRATIQTDDNALIYVTYGGLLELGPDGYAGFLVGELPPVFPIRTAPRFQTSHPAYLWLNRLQCIGVGQADRETSSVSYDVYAVV